MPFVVRILQDWYQLGIKEFIWLFTKGYRQKKRGSPRSKEMIDVTEKGVPGFKGHTASNCSLLYIKE